MRSNVSGASNKQRSRSCLEPTLCRGRSEMTEIKSCPFCGSKAEIIEQPPTGPLNTLYRVQCSGLGHTPYNHEATTNYFPTRQKAIEAWNTRAERTCRDVSARETDSKFTCSLCGLNLITKDDQGITMWRQGPAYIDKPIFCPGCGARVIEE